VNNLNVTTTARLATLDQLQKTTIAVFLDPIPAKQVLRDWFDAARIPRFKSNPAAKKGGGPCYYSVSAVEKFLRSRIIGKEAA
jgi:hypothetical protein